MPADPRNQCTANANATPAAAATGTNRTRHRYERQPIAHPSTTAAITCTVTGAQPCIKDTSATSWRNV
jgi:hypothetical protein